MNILDDATIHRLVFETFGMRRFTQDSPIQADVWVRFLRLADHGRLGDRVSLILTPKETPGKDGRPAGGAAQLAEKIRTSILGKTRSQEWEKARGTKISPEEELRPFKLASTGRSVVIDATFQETLRYLVPNTFWWMDITEKYRDPQSLQRLLTDAARKSATIQEALVHFDDTEFFRFVALTSIISLIGSQNADKSSVRALIEKVAPPIVLDEDQFPEPGVNAGEKKATLNDVAELWAHYSELAKDTFWRGGSREIGARYRHQRRRRQRGGIDLVRSPQSRRQPGRAVGPRDHTCSVRRKSSLAGSAFQPDREGGRGDRAFLDQHRRFDMGHRRHRD